MVAYLLGPYFILPKIPFRLQKIQEVSCEPQNEAKSNFVNDILWHLLW